MNKILKNIFFTIITFTASNIVFSETKDVNKNQNLNLNTPQVQTNSSSKTDTTQSIKLPNAVSTITKNTVKEFEKLSLMAENVKERLDRENKTIHSVNKIVVFYSNMLNTASVPVAINQNFLTYDLALNLNDETMELSTLFENEKSNLIINCCSYPYEILKMDGSVVKGVLTTERVQDTKNKVKIINFIDLLNGLENASNLTIEINQIPFKNIFTFELE